RDIGIDNRFKGILLELFLSGEPTWYSLPSGLNTAISLSKSADVDRDILFSAFRRRITCQILVAILMNNVSFQSSLTPFPFVDEPNSNIYYQMGVDVSNFRMIKNNIYRFNKSLCLKMWRPMHQPNTLYRMVSCYYNSLVMVIHHVAKIAEIVTYKKLLHVFRIQGNDLQFVVHPCGEKGVGLKCTSNIKKFYHHYYTGRGQYVLEFVGEIIDNTQFNQRVQKYTSINMKHSYIMALRSKCVYKFICEKSILMQHKWAELLDSSIIWSVGGYTRICFIAIDDILAESELTFDYKFERFGEPLKCLCGGANCSGFMGKPASRKSIPLISKVNNSLVKNAACSEKVLKNLVEAPEVATPRPRNPKTFVKYMIQLSDWSKRLKVVKYLKERCEPDFLKDLVNNKICFVLSSWLTHLDPIKCDIIHHKNFLVLFNLLPFEKREDVPFDNLSHILDLWMQQSSTRKVKGADINVVEFGRLCRVVLNKINHLTNKKSSNFIVNNVTNNRLVKKDESEKRAKFKHELSIYVVGCLKPYFNIDDPKAVISNHDRFSSIAKNLTNILMNKELERAKDHLMQLEFDEETRKCVYHQIKQYLSNSKKN
ncbi:hypothetical protein MXB_4576, partial [Myxobolus squamalis]